MPSQDLQSSLITSLSSQSLPIPSQSWLTTLLSSRGNPPPPLASLAATARARLLASDLTTPNLLDPAYIASHSLPADLNRPDVRATTINRDVVLQVLDIETLSTSRWSQVEELEALARGEGTKGREVVRLPVGGEAEEGERGVTQATQTQAQTQTQGRAAGRGAAAAATPAPSSGTHKLVLQDCNGLKVSGLELRNVAKIAIGTLSIGEKILIKAGASVSRGVIMLEPTTCVVLGGKVEAWHKAWVDGRLARLKEAAIASRTGN
jgi:RecQ-mediated genome instability protein 1